jgi:prevent-host-death family protein
MIKVSVADAKNRFSELVARAESGEEIAVTRHGKLVARLVADEQPNAAFQDVLVDDIFANLAALGRGLSIAGDLKEIARQGVA